MLHYAKEWKPELQDVDLNDLLQRICDLNQQTAAGKGVTLRHHVSEGLPSVRCDPELIHMAATDIVLNAIDACAWKDYPAGEHPEIVLMNSVTDGQNLYEIEIRDNGCGMNDEIRRNIFTPFFSTKKTRGTGLGLALTARIIKLHHGDISVESEPDRGTTFRMHLPIDGPQDTTREAVDG
jgi:signal transduction histidine kinase